METLSGQQGLVSPATADVIGHELRTPLSYILGYAKLLEENGLGPLTPEQKIAISSILKGTYNLLSVTEQLTALLMIQTHTSAFQPIDLSEIVAQIGLLAGMRAEQTGLHLSVDLADNAPPITADPYLLRQMVQALLDNALKFTMPGGRINVRVFEDDASVCLTVEDTGIGIRRNEFDRIFELFYQVDNSISRRFGGMGLGLTVIKAVVDQHGGTIQVTSHPNSGSRFLVKLPKSN